MLSSENRIDYVLPAGGVAGVESAPLAPFRLPTWFRVGDDFCAEPSLGYV